MISARVLLALIYLVALVYGVIPIRKSSSCLKKHFLEGTVALPLSYAQKLVYGVADDISEIGNKFVTVDQLQEMLENAKTEDGREDAAYLKEDFLKERACRRICEEEFLKGCLKRCEGCQEMRECFYCTDSCGAGAYENDANYLVCAAKCPSTETKKREKCYKNCDKAESFTECMLKAKCD